MTDQEEQKIPGWYAEIFPAGAADGWYHRLGEHAASFVDRGRHQLVVSFDNLATAGYPGTDIEPWAGEFIRRQGWSNLGIYAQGPSWYRDPRLIGFLEKLRDDGFFASFEKVSLIGTSMGGFAALTFSSLCPGATVVALSPQSTLCSDLVPWETRFRKGRVRDWSLPYSDAATQLEDVRRAYVLYDPFFIPDKRHVERLPAAKITPLRGFGFGHKSVVLLQKMDLLKPFMHAAINGHLEPDVFYGWARKRKGLYQYRRVMELHLRSRGQDHRVMPMAQAFRKHRRSL